MTQFITDLYLGFIWGSKYGIDIKVYLSNSMYQFSDWIAPGIPVLMGVVCIPVLLCCVMAGFVDMDKLNKEVCNGKS